MTFRKLIPDDFENYINECEHEGILATLKDIHAEGMDMFCGSFLLHEGDLHLQGDFDTQDIRPHAKKCVGKKKSDWEGTVVIFTGSLTVDGFYNDTCNDAPVCVFIAGDLNAKNINTAGFLEVTGNIASKEAIIGDYNDGGALIHGDLTTQVFLPFDHGFDIRGATNAVDYIERLRTDTKPTRLHPNYYSKTENGYELLSGEYEEMLITNGESILV